jgi:hypothetical protein
MNLKNEITLPTQRSTRPVLSTAESGEPGPVFAGSGLLCHNCGTTIATTIPIRHCPRCLTRYADVPPDPTDEPIEAIAWKIERSSFLNRLGGWWLFVGFSIGAIAGTITVERQLGVFAPFLYSRWFILVVYCLGMAAGGLLGGALGVSLQAVLRPVLSEVFDGDSSGPNLAEHRRHSFQKFYG